MNHLISAGLLGAVVLAALPVIGCATGPLAKPPAEALIHRLEAPRQGDVMIVAHRACWRSAPENSLQAIENCVSAGIDMVELDVRRTRDGALVLMHDDTVDRMTDGRGLVSSLSLRDLQSLKLRNGAGGPSSPMTDQRPITLAEGLEASRGRILVNIDAKADVYAEVRQLLVAMDMARQVLVKVEADPDDPRLSRTDLFSTAHFMPIIRQDRGAEALRVLVPLYRPFRPVAYEIVFQTEPYLLDGVDDIQAEDARVWANTMLPIYSAGLTDAGALADPEAHWGRLIDLGVDMIQTDEPERLAAFLIRRGIARRQGPK